MIRSQKLGVLTKVKRPFERNWRESASFQLSWLDRQTPAPWSIAFIGLDFASFHDQHRVLASSARGRLTGKSRSSTTPRVNSTTGLLAFSVPSFVISGIASAPNPFKGKIFLRENFSRGRLTGEPPAPPQYVLLPPPILEEVTRAKREFPSKQNLHVPRRPTAFKPVQPRVMPSKTLKRARITASGPTTAQLAAYLITRLRSPPRKPGAPR
jgi:hypothetical protein